MAYHCWCQGRQMWRSVDNCGDIARTCHGRSCRETHSPGGRWPPLNSQRERESSGSPMGSQIGPPGPSLVPRVTWETRSEGFFWRPGQGDGLRTRGRSSLRKVVEARQVRAGLVNGGLGVQKEGCLVLSPYAGAGCFQSGPGVPGAQGTRFFQQDARGQAPRHRIRTRRAPDLFITVAMDTHRSQGPEPQAF